MKELEKPDLGINEKRIPVKNKEEAVKTTDKLDEQVLRDEIKSGGHSSQWFYLLFNKQTQKEEYKLGVAGIRELHRRRGAITIPIEKYREKETKNTWEMALEAIDSKMQNSNIGIYVQPKFQESNSGPLPDPYAKQICYSKTYRNAVETLIEQKYKDELLQDFKKLLKKVKTNKKPVKKTKKSPVKKAVKIKKPVAKKKNIQPSLFKK